MPRPLRAIRFNYKLGLGLDGLCENAQVRCATSNGAASRRLQDLRCVMSIPLRRITSSSYPTSCLLRGRLCELRCQPAIPRPYVDDQRHRKRRCVLHFMPNDRFELLGLLRRIFENELVVHL